MNLNSARARATWDYTKPVYLFEQRLGWMELAAANDPGILLFGAIEHGRLMCEKAYPFKDRADTSYLHYFVEVDPVLAESTLITFVVGTLKGVRDVIEETV